MKLQAIAAFSAIVVFSAQALGQSCSGSSRLSATDLQTLLPGKWVCGAIGNQSWNELHMGAGASGQLQDWKKGPNDPIDPTAIVGSWSISGNGNGNNGTVTYTYGSSSYSYSVSPVSGSQYSYCGASSGAPTLFVTINSSHC